MAALLAKLPAVLISDKQVLARIFPRPDADDLRELVQNRWLNDDTIDCFLELVRKSVDPSRIICYAMGFSAVMRAYTDERIGKGLRQTKWKDARIVVLPLHAESHFTVAILDVAARRIEYYEPKGGTDWLHRLRKLWRPS